MFYGRYGTAKQIEDDFKVIIFARGNGNIVRQLEICQNFAAFCEYDVVGVATEIKTLFETATEYDGVLVSAYNRISRDALEYQRIKQELLKKEKIIISAVRSF